MTEQSYISFNTTGPDTAQPVQAPQQPAQPVQAPQQPAQPVQAPQQPAQPYGTFTIPSSILANQADMIEDYQKSEMQNTPSAYQSIIDQQNAQIVALIEQNNSLTGQITQLIGNGAQISQQPQPQNVQVGRNWSVEPQYAPVYEGNGFAPASLAQDVDLSLEGLASEIGKKS